MLNKRSFRKYLPSLEALYTPFLVAKGQATLTIKANTYVKIINAGVHTIQSFDVATDVVVATALDTGAIAAGLNYYVYLCDDGAIKVSLNSTYPAGYTAANSRKIGGFHTLCIAAGTIAGHSLTDFAVKAILPASVWCLNHRPKYAGPEGMAFDPLSNLWWDIYLQSSTGATTASVNGATITDTRVWNDHVADLAAVKKRLPFDAEFQLAAAGSNQKTNIAGSADPVTTGGHSDTAGRRMLSNIGLEDMCGAMWQWLQDQSWRLDIGAPTYSAAAQTLTLYHAAAPGGNPIYVKYGLDGTPYLCCNLAAAGLDKVVTFGVYKLVIKHDAGANTGLPLYFDYDATLPLRFLVNNTIYAKDTYAFSNDPSFMLILKHDASAATNGVAVNYDDGADNRLEFISPGSANATQDLATSGPAWGYQDVGNNEGSVYKQGTYGDIKLRAGGYWYIGTNCGSRCRTADSFRWPANSICGARGCAEPL